MAAIFVIAFLVMLFLGAPMAACFVVPCMLVPLLGGNLAAVTWMDIVKWFAEALLGSDVGITIVLFIVAGAFMSKGRITEKIFNTFLYHFGKIRGFLPILSILTCMFYGAISGSGPATTAAVGSVCFPILVKMGYTPAFSAAVLAATGCLGMVIPPSGPLTGSCLTAGKVLEADLNLTEAYRIAAKAGITAGFFMIIYTYFHCLRHEEGNSRLISEYVDKLRKNSFGAILKDSIWAFMLPVIIMLGIFSGIVNIFQVAAFSLVYTILISVFVYKTICADKVLNVLFKSVSNCLRIIVMLGTASVFGKTIVALKIPDYLTELLVSTGADGPMILCMVLLLVLAMGTVMDSGSAVQIIVPIVAPLILSFGMNIYTSLTAIIMAQAIGQITPPYGLSLFVMCDMAKISRKEVSIKLIPFIFIGAALCFAVAL